VHLTLYHGAGAMVLPHLTQCRAPSTVAPSLTIQGGASRSPANLRMMWLGHKVFTPWIERGRQCESIISPL